LQQTRNERVYFFDGYRTLAVASVLALHAAMSYMAYVPDWWYVINPENSMFFLFWVLLANTGDMPAIFFMAGFFAPRSLEKRGPALFLKEKALHIGIPWAIGVLAFAPLFAMATWRSLNLPLPDTYLEFVRDVWLGPGYQQSHFWFLGVLMTFLVVFAAVGRAYSGAASTVSPLRRLVCWWAVSSVAFFLSSLRWHPDLWIPLGPIYFQPARIISYALAFHLGAVAWRDGWFDGPAPGAGALATGAAAAFAGGWSVIHLAMNYPSKDTLLLKAAHAASHSFASLAVAALFLLLCRALLDRPSRIVRALSDASYGIYWLHQMVLMPAVYLLIPFDIPIGLKFTVALAGTYAVCAAATLLGLKRLPVLKRLF
jgi:peptidoglycan/LPS O-acetylase OafA/YrhL